MTKPFKFDVVIGNPPYQGDNHQQIYPDFYIGGQVISDNLCLIFPSSWQEPKRANNLGKLNKEEIKADKQIIQIDNRQNVFPNVPGAEWTNIILWKRGFDNKLDGKQKILTNGENPVVKKLYWNKNDVKKPKEIEALANLVVNSLDFESLQKSTSVLKPYGLSTDVFKNPAKYDLQPFMDERLSASDFVVFGGGAKKTQVKYVPSDYNLPRVTKALNKYKIFVPYAWGNMSEKTGLGGAYSDIIIAKPNDIATETFQESGCFDTLDDARKHAKYLLTKFTRALLYFNKHSQHSTTAWGAVPVQHYQEDWWTKSISEIDNKLMDKYNISAEIRSFISKNIQEKNENNIIESNY